MRYPLVGVDAIGFSWLGEEEIISTSTVALNLAIGDVSTAYTRKTKEPHKYSNTNHTQYANHKSFWWGTFENQLHVYYLFKVSVKIYLQRYLTTFYFVKTTKASSLKMFPCRDTQCCSRDSVLYYKWEVSNNLVIQNFAFFLCEATWQLHIAWWLTDTAVRVSFRVLVKWDICSTLLKGCPTLDLLRVPFNFSRLWQSLMEYLSNCYSCLWVTKYTKPSTDLE